MRDESRQILQELANARGDPKYMLRNRVDNMIRDIAQELLHLRIPEGADRGTVLLPFDLRRQQLELFAAKEGLGSAIDRLLRQLRRELERIRNGGDPRSPFG
jgi:hypothetical protein